MGVLLLRRSGVLSSVAWPELQLAGRGIGLDPVVGLS